MKYVIRRLIASVVVVPIVAGLYVLGIISLVMLGFQPTANIDEVYANGWLIGIVSGIAFVFYPQLSKMLDKAF